MMLDALARFDGEITRLGVVLAPDGSPFEREGVLNPASATMRDGSLLLYPRDVAEGNVSRVGLCRGIRSGEELRFERMGFALEPEAPYEVRTVSGGMGCEDPRVTFVPVLDRYVMAYTAFGPDGPRIAIALSVDGHRWERLGLVRFAPELHQGDDKDGAFFPEALNAASSANNFTLSGSSTIQTDSGVYQIGGVVANGASTTGTLVKTGAGTPPVRIEEGWFSIFHGVDAQETENGSYRIQYSAGFVVHDLERPHIVRYRSGTPEMVPEGVDETHGIVNNVVFPTAIEQRGERSFEFFYGMADARVGRASVKLAAPSEGAEESAA